MTTPVVLITGASGMLGRALTARLASDYTVVGVDVAEPPTGTTLDSVHYMDVTSDMSVREALEAVRAEHGRKLAAVVHLAAFYDFSGADSLRTERVITEHEPAVPYTLLRIAGVYTDWASQPTLVQQVRRIHEQDFESFFFPGDSKAGQSLVHLDDTVDAIARTVDRRDALRSLPILIGEPDPPACAELQDRIGELLWGERWPPDPGRRHSRDPGNRWPAVGHAPPRC